MGMKYLAQRLMRAALLFVGVSILCFLFTQMAPGNFFDEMRLNPQISPETISLLRAHYGLDQPLAIRYFRWISSVARGDFGYSLAYNAPVTPLLLTRAKNTLRLTSIAALLTWLIGLPVGIWSANCRGKLVDKVIGTASSLSLSLPEVVLAIGLLALAVRTRIAPVGGMASLGADDLSTWQKLLDILKHMWLPVSMLVLGGIGTVERHVRASVSEALEASCIQAARALGISQTRLLFRHALPLAGNPLISLFGFSLAGLLGGSLLVEVIAGWPGLGPLVLEATLARDLFVVIGAMMLSAIFMLLGNFIADLLLLACDPRIRSGDADAM
jgi:peptide/nickel transport system permease protein